MAKPTIDPTAHYLARMTASWNDGTVVHAGERRHGRDPVVAQHPEAWVREDETTPEAIAAEESARATALMREAREESGYYGRPEVNRTVEVVQKDRVVWTGPNTYIDVGAGTEVVAQGTVMEAGDRRLDGLDPERVRPFERVFGPDGAVA